MHFYSSLSFYTGISPSHVNLIYIIDSLLLEFATLTWQTGVLIWRKLHIWMGDSDYVGNFMEAHRTQFCQTCVMLTSYMSRELYQKGCVTAF